MRKSLTAIALCHVIAFAFSASSFSSAQAMPAPEAGDVELSVGLIQWGAETEVPLGMSRDEMIASMLELKHPPQAAKTKAALCETLAAAAQIHDLPVGFFVRLINQESGFNPEVVSPAGAQGVAQFMPKVAEEWGLKNPFEPHTALLASARFLRSLYEQFGNWGLAAAAYNGGMGRVQKWIDKRGKLPEETRHYVMTITGVPAEKWADGKPGNPKFSIPARAPCQEMAHLADPPGKLADTSGKSIPLPPSRAPKVIQATGPGSSKTTRIAAIPAITTLKSGMKVAVIKVKGATKAATVTARISAPAPIVAIAARPKDNRGKTTVVAAVVEKSSSKSQTKAKDAKKGKTRVQVADARNARK